MMWRVVTVLVVLALPSTAFAEDDAQRRAREELEKQLAQMVGTAPSRVRIEFKAIDDPNFRVEAFELSVDGKVIKSPTPAAISAWIEEGAMPIGVVDVAPGRRKVNVRVEYHNTASVMVSEEGDFRWKVAGDVGFDVTAGLEVKVIITAVRDPKQTDMNKRIKLTFPSHPSMISRLDDGTMPEPSKLQPAPIDAGPTKEQRKADEAAAERQRKADEAKLAKAQSAEEAKLEKAAAAEEKKRKVEEAKLAKVQSAEEKKRKAEEAKLAIVQAAEEKKRLAEEARLAALKPAVPVEPVVAVDAGAVVVEVKPVEPVDAGAVAVAKAPPVAVEEGPPWMLIGGGVGIALLAIVVALVRRSGRVPELKD
jgi:hypothetical protein